MAEGSVYFGAVAGSYASGLCFANYGYQVAYCHTKKRIMFFSDGLLCIFWPKQLRPALQSLLHVKHQGGEGQQRLCLRKVSCVQFLTVHLISRPAPSLLVQLKTAWDNRGQGRLLLVCHSSNILHEISLELLDL